MASCLRIIGEGAASMRGASVLTDAAQALRWQAVDYRAMAIEMSIYLFSRKRGRFGIAGVDGSRRRGRLRRLNDGRLFSHNDERVCYSL